MSTFIESLKETNKIETKQQKSKSKNNILDYSDELLAQWFFQVQQILSKT